MNDFMKKEVAMKKPFVIFKLGALTLAALLCMGALTACGKKTDVSATRVVGTVDGNEILYDELYALATRYHDTVEANCEGDTARMQTELDRLIRENIIVNTAMLRLCETVELTYDEKALSTRVDAELSSMLNESFEGDEELFEEAKTENGLTDRYLRYSMGIDLLYDELLVQYPLHGLVASDEASVRAYLDENCVHIYHLVRFFDESNKDEQLARITAARDALRSGEKTMYALIKAGESEDFMDPSGKGYYVIPGTMNEDYERAAFALKLNEVSEVIVSEGTDNNGRTSSCYYVLQRFPMDETYVDSHLAELTGEYYGSVIYADLEEMKKAMTFEPNSFYGELDLCELLPPREGMSTGAVIAIVAGCAAAVIGLAVVGVILIRKKPKRKGAVVRSKHE